MVKKISRTERMTWRIREGNIKFTTTPFKEPRSTKGSIKLASP